MSSVRTLEGFSNNVGCGTDMVNYTIAANISIAAGALSGTNDFVDVEAWGTCQNTTDAKDLLLDVGGGQVMHVNFPSNQTDWHLKARFYYSNAGGNPQRCWAKIEQDGGFIAVQTATPSFDWSSAQNVLIQIRSTNGTANAITCNKAEVHSEAN